MEFIRILGKFIPKYKWRIVVYIILNIVCSICSVFSFAAIVPLLNILFGISDKGIEKLSGDNMAQGGLSVADGCRCLTKELDMIAC